jgi:amidohydrolase
MKLKRQNLNFKILASLFLCLVGSHMLSAQNKPKKGQPQGSSNASWVKNISENEIIEWRRHVHQNPELSFKEENTATYVADLLKSFGNIEVIRPTKTSVLGILKGTNPGKTVAFRADMDGLPIQEETGLAFASQNKSISHACGHDAHTAMLLGTAKALSTMKGQIKGTVYFLFQHAEEEAPGGALDIIKSGALKDVNAFFGLHVIPNFPVGHIGVLPNGAASTTSDGFFLTINGKGSHGSMPQLGVDPVVVGAELVTALQTIVSRNITPGEMAVITVGKFQSGDAPNVIPDKAELAASIRTITDETRTLVEARIRTLIENITKANGATYDLKYILSYPAIKNDPALNALVKASATKALGKDRVFDAPRMTASEDFSYYNQIAPTVFMILGVGEGVANHNPKFNLDEKALINGATAEVQIVLDYLNN